MSHLIFDVDKTLVEVRQVGDGRLIYTEEFLPGRLEWFTRLAREENRPVISLCSNQGGVNIRWLLENGIVEWSNRTAADFPTEEEARARIERIADKIREMGFEVAVFVAFAWKGKGGWARNPYRSSGEEEWWAAANENDHYVFGTTPEPPPEWTPEWRKPAPGMLLAAVKHWGYSIGNSLMIGDSPEDKEAAKAAGIIFAQVDRFFGWRFPLPEGWCWYIQDKELINQGEVPGLFPPKWIFPNVPSEALGEPVVDRPINTVPESCDPPLLIEPNPVVLSSEPLGTPDLGILLSRAYNLLIQFGKEGQDTDDNESENSDDR